MEETFQPHESSEKSDTAFFFFCIFLQKVNKLPGEVE